jgi:hypothetical protein
MTFVFEGFADDFLRAAAGIAVRGVEGVDALFMNNTVRIEPLIR